MKNKVKSCIVMFALCVMGFIVFIVGSYLKQLSYEMANLYPELAHMRLPILILLWLVLACVIAMLVVAFLLSLRIYRDNFFEQKSVNLLKIMSIIALIPVPILIGVYVYTEANINGSITNFWVTVGIMAFVSVSILISLMTSFFQQAVDYKTENELTI